MRGGPVGQSITREVEDSEITDLIYRYRYAKMYSTMNTIYGIMLRELEKYDTYEMSIHRQSLSIALWKVLVDEKQQLSFGEIDQELRKCEYGRIRAMMVAKGKATRTPNPNMRHY